jgi:hypothetical protein
LGPGIDTSFGFGFGFGLGAGLVIDTSVGFGRRATVGLTVATSRTPDGVARSTPGFEPPAPFEPARAGLEPAVFEPSPRRPRRAGARSDPPVAGFAGLAPTRATLACLAPDGAGAPMTAWSEEGWKM